MRKPPRLIEPKDVPRFYRNTATEPNAEQVKELLALNKRLFPLMINTMELTLEKERLLNQRLEDKNDPLADYELEISIVFYHKHTKEILAIDKRWAHPSNNGSILHFISDFSFLFPMKFTDSAPISEWMGSLLDTYKLNWYELLNIGEIELRVNTQYQYFEYINDNPNKDE